MKTNRKSSTNKFFITAGLGGGLLFSAFYHGIATSLAADDESREKLESVSEQIKELTTDLDAARSESEKLQAELQETEIAAGREALKLKGLDEQISKQKKRLAELGAVIEKHRQSLEQEQARLAEQIRAAYMAGRGDYLKLLLNQEDPGRVGRVLAYYDYYNRARARSIHSIQAKLDLIAELAGNIEAETTALQQLKQRQLTKSRDLASYRQSREAILQQLETVISSKGDELKSLQEEKEKLARLLQQLEQPEKTDSIEHYRDVPPFGSLKGRLDWPVQGRLLNQFGSNRKGAALKWQGVRLGVDAGTDVRAVHSGKVIFADWFRNLGLLVILDHGDGYMSLYGYNQSLLKKAGDWVLAGETIAHAGDSGGQPVPGVYFEIRQNGKPVNPALWCRR